MPKKFVPDEELRNKILEIYEETNNYSAVSRAVGLTPSVVKRIITENKTNGKIFSFQTKKIPEEPLEQCSKIQFYYQLQLLAFGGEINV